MFIYIYCTMHIIYIGLDSRRVALRRVALRCVWLGWAGLGCIGLLCLGGIMMPPVHGSEGSIAARTTFRGTDPPCYNLYILHYICYNI